MKVFPKPTEAELSILRVIWSRGPSTVREIQEVLERTRPTGYTTVLKILQIMTEKGLVQRQSSGRAHIYRARRSEEQTQQQLVSDLLERAFGGSAAKLVVQALGGKKATTEEWKEIQELLGRRRSRRDNAKSS
jgi:BlaI family transcriptional regulator, penicillinase repressor